MKDLSVNKTAYINPKNCIYARTETTMKATTRISRSSGLTFNPSVSSSKNLSSPALWAGMGALLSSLFFLRLLIGVRSINLK